MLYVPLLCEWGRHFVCAKSNRHTWCAGCADGVMLYYAVLCFFDVVNKPFADLAGAVCFGAVGCDVLGYYSSIH